MRKRDVLNVRSQLVPDINNSLVLSVRRVLLFFVVLLLVRTVTVWIALLGRYGSVQGVLEHGGEIYCLTRHGLYGPGLGMPLPVDYLACFFAGVYTGFKGRFSFLSSLAIGSVIVLHIGLQGRLTIFMGFVLFFLAVWYASPRRRRSALMRQLLILSVVFIATILLVSATRGLGKSLPARGWGRLAEDIPAFSLYYYASVGIAGLNEYIKGGRDAMDVPYTVAPLLRILGMKVPLYEPTVFYTPIPTITITWLAALHHDFGWGGVMIFPWVIGFVSSYLEMQLRRRKSLLALALLSHFYLILILSFHSYALFIASWWLSFLTSAALGFIIDKGVLTNLIRVLKGKHINLRLELKGPGEW